MAMPAWAYYYQQVFNDKTLNIDPAARFLAPSSMQNDILFDYDQINTSDEVIPSEGVPLDGKAVEIPISDGSEKVVTESQKFEDPNEETDLQKNNPNANKELDVKSNTDTTKKRRSGFIKRMFKRKDQ